MSTISSRRELLNARVYFIPVGKVVDSVTVSETTWPDNSPLTNYTNYMLHDTEEITKVKSFDTEEIKVPKDTGGYADDPESTLKNVMFEGKTHKTREIFKQLEWGLSDEPEIDAAQTPFAQNSDFIEGVVLMEFQNKTGAATETVQFWAKLRLKDDGGVGPKTRLLTYELEYVVADNNTYVLKA